MEATELKSNIKSDQSTKTPISDHSKESELSTLDIEEVKELINGPDPEKDPEIKLTQSETGSELKKFKEGREHRPSSEGLTESPEHKSSLKQSVDVHSTHSQHSDNPSMPPTSKDIANSPSKPEPKPPARKTKSYAPNTPKKPETSNLYENTKVLLSTSEAPATAAAKMPPPTIERGKQHEEETRREPEDFTEEIVLRNKRTEHIDMPPKPQHRESYMIKTKGNLFFKKKGTFSKWKLHFVVVDDFKIQMNFFKSQEEYQNLARCKLSIDLRFVMAVKAQKQRLLQSNYPFKMQRRAGLSTVKLAAYNEEERAKWITTIEGIMLKVKMTSERDFIVEEKRSSTLPNMLNQSGRSSTDSETHTTASAPDQADLIKPKKVSSSGFKLDSQQISSVKLKRISSEKREPETVEQKTEKDGKDACDPKEKFGVNLRRVQTEKSPARNEREQSPEYIEFKQKYNSLSLSRKNKVPKLPLNENSVCSHLVEIASRNEIDVFEPAQPKKELKEINRKRSPSPNIPISKAVEAVIKNKSTDEQSKSLPDNFISELCVCHATSTLISYDESSDLNINETASTNNEESLLVQPDIKLSEEVMDDKKLDTEVEILVTTNDPLLQKVQHYMEIQDESISTIESTTQIPKTDKTESEHNFVKSEDISSMKLCQTSIKIELENQSSMNEEVDNDRLLEVDDKDKENFQHDSNLVDEADTKIVLPSLKISKPEEIYTNDNLTENTDEEIIRSEIVLTEIVNESEDKSIEYENEAKTCRNTSRGIMSQRQIDSIVFGDEILTADSLLSDSKSELNVRVSFQSFQSQQSTESDEPLPKFNFLGKGDRSSSGSASMKDFLNLEENKTDKSSDSEESVDHAGVMREKSLKAYGTESSTDKETRSSLVMPEFTVVEERADELLLDERADNILPVITLEKEPVLNITENLDNSDLVRKSSTASDCSNKSNTEDEKKENKTKLDLEENSATESSEDLKFLTQTKPQLLFEYGYDPATFIYNTNITDDVDELTTDFGIGNQYSLSETVNNSNKEDKNAKDNDSPDEIEIIHIKENEMATEHKLLQESERVIHEHEEVVVIRKSDPYPLQVEDVISNDQLSKPLEDPETEQDTPISSVQEEKEEIIKEIEFEETEDYFPTYGSIEYRIKDENLSVLHDNEIRTSGIQGLKEFLRENGTEDSSHDAKSGISRLGHSPAIEKLRNETQ